MNKGNSLFRKQLNNYVFRNPISFQEKLLSKRSELQKILLKNLYLRKLSLTYRIYQLIYFLVFCTNIPQILDSMFAQVRRPRVIIPPWDHLSYLVQEDFLLTFLHIIFTIC